jgi:hypothetical protein
MNWYKKAMPINADYLNNLHDPRIREHLDPKTEIVVYHGTSSKKLANILAHGSLDHSISGLEEYKSYQGASPGIFVTTDATGFQGAEMYGHHAANDDEEGDGGDPVILEMVVPWVWIEPDPDDKHEHLARRQGVINRPISIKRIRSMKIKNSILSQEIPTESSNFFDMTSTQWLPIGKMIDVISKMTQAGYELGEEYYMMVNNRPKRLSRQDPYEDREGRLATNLSSIMANFFSIDQGVYDKALAWIFQNKNNLYGDALALLVSFVEYSGKDSKYLLESMPDYYKPNSGEGFMSYINRIAN